MQLTALFIGVGIQIAIIALLYFHLNGKIKKRDTSAKVLSDVRREVDEMIVELNQTTDRNIGLIEERVRRIAKAVEEADKRIRLLQKSTDAFTMNTATYSSVRPRVRQEDAKKAKEVEPDSGERKNDSRTLQNGDFARKAFSAESAREGKSARGVQKKKEESPQEVESPPHKREKVRDMYRQGMSAEVIASRLDVTVGEVELMITLLEEKNR